MGVAGLWGKGVLQGFRNGVLRRFLVLLVKFAKPQTPDP